MEFEPFPSRCDSISRKETRTIIVNANDVGVPRGKYVFLESYCPDEDCDCAKAMIAISEAEPPHRIFATIGYGWETFEFYKKWMFGDEELAKTLMGAYIELGGTQSQYSQNFLEIFKTRLTKDYIEMIKRHYKLFKGL